MRPREERTTVKERAALHLTEPACPGMLGRYEVIRRLASGGMAELYLARSTGVEGFEKLVVIKRILPLLVGSREVVDMFLDEARIAATLRHSNIVQVFDIGTQDGEYFIAMEFLHGQDLGTILRTAAGGVGAAVPIEHAVNIALGVCAGLHYAHDQVNSHGQPLHIVHRDVSPQNVLVTYEGEVKLVDFGIARARDRLAETQQGTLKGKIRYMSPEQARAEPLDRRADIFSLGILLWEMLAGRQLFRGLGELEVLTAITETDTPAPSRYNPRCPVELDRLVLRALRRSRRERYHTARELQSDLEEFALERKLPVSTLALARFVSGLFQADLDAWRAAQRSGASLVEHVSRSMRTVDGATAAAGSFAEDDSAAPRPPLALAPLDDSAAPRPLAQAPAGDVQSPAPRRRRALVIAAATLVGAVAAVILVLAVLRSRPGVGSAVVAEARPGAEAAGGRGAAADAGLGSAVAPSAPGSPAPALAARRGPVIPAGHSGAAPASSRRARGSREPREPARPARPEPARPEPARPAPEPSHPAPEPARPAPEPSRPAPEAPARAAAKPNLDTMFPP